MRKKNIVITIALIVAVVSLILILGGCSFNVGPLRVDISRRVPGKSNVNENQPGTENKNFGDDQNLKNPKNIKNIPFMGIEMTQSKDGKGVLVEYVITGSPAEKAGIKAQDIIINFDGKEVASPAELYTEVQSHKVGDNVKVTVNRNGQSMELNVTLGSFKDIVPNIKKNNQNNLEKSESQGNQVY
jgi:predicted metalloprotease with PDZ domain